MKNLLKVFQLTLLIVLMADVALAQQDAQFSHYMYNAQYVNSGSVGVEGVTRGTLLFRKQWAGYASSDNYIDNGSSPISVVFGLNTRLPLSEKLKLGAGLHVVNDVRGPQGTTELQGALSFLIPMADGHLGIGFRPGFVNQRIDFGYLRPENVNDPIYVALSQNSSQSVFDFGGGLYFQNQKFFLGVSGNHLLESKINYGTTAANSYLARHLYFTGGINFDITPSLQLTPTTIVQTDLKQSSLLIGPQVLYNNKIFGGINARQSIAQKDVQAGGKSYSFDDLVVNVGMNLMKNNALRVGYAFDLVTSGKKAKSGTSHEVMLSYMIPGRAYNPPPPVRSPRYRHEEN